MREVYDDSQSTAVQKRISRQSPRPSRSRGRRQSMMQQIPGQYQKYMNTRIRMKKRTTRIMTRRVDASGARHNCDVELGPGREAHRNTRECAREETIDDEVTKATDHTCPTS